MLPIKKHYQEPNAKQELSEALQHVIPAETEIIILCAGSDRHLLDCLGPLTGTMILEKIPQARVYGTLDHPLHGRNMIKRLAEIKRENLGKLEIAIDASLGNDEELGMLKLRAGALLPGKALARSLPGLGDYSITGVVGNRSDKFRLKSQNGSLGPIYHMAYLISSAIDDWYQTRP